VKTSKSGDKFYSQGDRHQPKSTSHNPTLRCGAHRPSSITRLDATKISPRHGYLGCISYFGERVATQIQPPISPTAHAPTPALPSQYRRLEQPRSEIQLLRLARELAHKFPQHGYGKTLGSAATIPETRPAGAATEQGSFKNRSSL
jgi:hypothetical protein